MPEYFEIKEFNDCSYKNWDEFCIDSKDTWLWHTSHGILSKSFWTNHFNYSFCVIDKSNKMEIVAVFPLFLIKRRKIIDYSSFDSLGGPAFCSSVNKKKTEKIIKFIDQYIDSLLKKMKVNKCEILFSSLSDLIIDNKKLIPNPLGPFINNDKSSFTWIKSLKNISREEIFNSFSYNVKSILKKNQKSLIFDEIKQNQSKKFLKTYFILHKETSLRKKINSHNFKYFEYIFNTFPKNNKKMFYVKKNNKILSISIFGIYKKNVIYWTNVSDKEGLDYGSNSFLMWKALEYFHKYKYENFEFGEGFFQNTNKDKIFLNHFKKSFGGEKVPLYRGEKVVSKYKDIFINILRDIRLKKNEID